MQTPRSRRLAGLGGVLALAMAPALASAQDGQREVGPPTTTPRTDKNKAGTGTAATPRVGSEVLTPVPATATDPAPPGTRVERVDVPGASSRSKAAGSPAPTATGPGAGAGAEAQPNVPGLTPSASLPAGVMTAEGVIVDKIQKPGKDLPDEQIRFSVDPSRNWAEFTAPGSVAPVEEAADAKGETPKRVDLVLTKRSALTTFARTPDGQAVPDQANPTAPSEAFSRTSDAATPNIRRRIVSPTNFTVLRPGQFVAVQYRKAGDVNEVVALSVINRPTQVDPAPGSGPAPAGTGRAGSGTAGSGTAGPNAGGNGGANRGTGKAATPVRVPRVPTTPNTPGGVSSTGRG